jgi:ATP phosphoribosyltransferase regulatory subunit
VKTAQILTGDLAIFPAFIDALGLSPLMTGRLKRAFRQEGGLKAMLESEAAPLPEAAQKILASAEPVAALEQALAAQNVDMFGARSLGEIVEGLAARAEHSEAGELPAHARDCFAALGAVSCALPDAPGTLLRLSRAHGLANTENVIEQLAERIRLIQPQAIRALCQFRTGFGRRFTYYDGFLFEVFGLGLTERQPIAAGGRYDGLITALSFGRASASGIGGVVRPDRMLRVERAA